jgi:S-adenosylmethionine hydrolase
MITLASDFGDPYPAAMRGVVLRAAPDARPVDVTHRLPRGDIRAGAFWLAFLLPEFPPAVHCCVVDPGVGTDRAALAVRAGEHVLVGPDNGLLLPPARALADGDVDVFEWRYENPASATFHGRDVFAPAAAAVHRAGVDAVAGLERTDRTDEYVDLRLPEPEHTPAGAVGEVLVVDDFGNCITNVPGEALPSVERVTVDGETVPVGGSFAAVEPGERLVTVGSHGNLECDVNDGRGEEAFGLAPGDAVRFEW